MPELPEVETIKRSLEPRLINKKIIDCKIFYEGCLKTHTENSFINEVKNTFIEKIERRGKYLKIYIDSSKVLLIHLRMTGRLIVCSQNDPVTKHTHIIFYLDDGSELRFIDIRKFGTIYLLKPIELTKVHGYRILGPEPFDEKNFTLEYLKKSLSNRKKNIKNLLLDQKTVAGIGNIYADEILFSAGINPQRVAGSLSSEEVEKLYHSIKKELQKGIDNRGTSFSDYVDGEGEKGSNQDSLNVYKKSGKVCNNCNCKITKTKIAGRSSHYCPGCQQ